jgi:hypothetical protein
MTLAHITVLEASLSPSSAFPSASRLSCKLSFVTIFLVAET